MNARTFGNRGRDCESRFVVKNLPAIYGPIAHGLMRLQRFSCPLWQRIAAFFASRRIKSAGIWTLALIAGAAFQVSFGLSVENENSQNNAIASLSDSAGEEAQGFDDLMAALQSTNAYERQRAAIALGASSDAKAVDALIKALDDKDSFVRSFAAKALGDIGDSKAVAALIKALDDENLLVRRSAATALGHLGDPAALDPLIHALKNGHFILRRSAAAALGELRHAGAIAPLIEALGSEDIYIRDSAATALDRIGVNAIDPLVDALGDWMRGPKAAEILKSLNWEPSSDAERVRFDIAERNGEAVLSNWEAAKKVLMDDANSENIRRAQNAVFALIGIGRDEVIEELVAILGENGSAEMARAFFDCGNGHLHEAARKWAKEHNVRLEDADGNPIVKWGAMKAA